MAQNNQTKVHIYIKRNRYYRNKDIEIIPLQAIMYSNLYSALCAYIKSNEFCQCRWHISQGFVYNTGILVLWNTPNPSLDPSPTVILWLFNHLILLSTLKVNNIFFILGSKKYTTKA